MLQRQMSLVNGSELLQHPWQDLSQPQTVPSASRSLAFFFLPQEPAECFQLSRVTESSSEAGMNVKYLEIQRCYE